MAPFPGAGRCCALTRYRTIVADPPWPYERDRDRWPSSRSSRRDAPRGDGKLTHNAIPYQTMSVVAIAGLDVASLALDDAALFLWTTNRYLPDAFFVLTAWGFDYRQTLVWHKTGNPSPFGGSVAPNHAEFLLVAKRGKPALTRWATSVIAAPAPQCGQHSTKPDAFLDMVEQISPGPYLELFARRTRLGWDSWGDEVDSDIEFGRRRLIPGVAGPPL